MQKMKFCETHAECEACVASLDYLNPALHSKGCAFRQTRRSRFKAC